ncbi:MAG: YIP1 family protein, partial [Firmicutes bacterium]|nr:YIP1 family protein [Bacillota bacterium]
MEIQPQTGTGSPGFFTRFGRLFVSPFTLFAELAVRPDFLWPIVFLLLIAGFSYPISQYTAKVMADTYPKYAEMMAAAKGRTLLPLALLSSAFSLAIPWLVRTGVFTLFAKLLGGGPQSFKAAFSAVGYTYLPEALRGIFQGGVLLLTGTLPPVGLEMGMEITERFFTPLGVFLGEINPFTVGYFILTSIALEKAFKLSRGKAVFT